MKIFIVIYSLLMLVAIILFIMCSFFYEKLPQIFNRKAYKVWKHVMSLKHPKFDKVYSYIEEGIEWHINIRFEDDPDILCTIFRRYREVNVLVYDDYKVAFSSYWRKHADKIIERFLPEIREAEIIHL